MKSYMNPNVAVDFLDIETCSSIGEAVFQLSPVFLVSASVTNHTLLAGETMLVHVLVFSLHCLFSDPSEYHFEAQPLNLELVCKPNQYMKEVWARKQVFLAEIVI